MLHYTVLFFAVGLASSLPHHGGNHPPLPEWGPAYKVDGEMHIPVAETIEPFTIWFDKEKGMTRIDLYGGTNRNYYVPSKNFPGRMDEYQVYPTTTESELNAMECRYVSGIQAYQELCTLPNMTGFSFVGAEKMFGKDASKFYKYQNDTMTESILWVAHETDVTGRERPVPLRLAMRSVLSMKQGRNFIQIYVDYYNYEIKKIDPGIFKLDASCKFLTENHSTTEHHFNNFKIKHGKQYTSEEEHAQRLHIFSNNLRNIEAHNRAGRGYKLAVNHLADRTPGELAAMTGLIPTRHSVGGLPFPYDQDEIDLMSSEIPEQWDWRIHGAVTPVKHQGDCGSCWAFSAVGAVEGALRLHSRRPVARLSEQALIDCTWGDTNRGCLGGSEDYAFDWIKKHGLPRYLDYGGYLGVNGFCHRANVTDVVNITDYVRVPPGQADALRLAVFKHGPISVGIAALNSLFFYSEGVYSDPDCKIKHINHAVLVVGFGVLDGRKYWLVKNSWGSQWGNQGYVLMAADGNTCHILDEPLYVTFDK